VLWLVVAGALAVAADVAAPAWLAGYGDLLIAVVVVAAGVAAFFEKDTRVGFASWMATAFGAVYVGLLAALVRLAWRLRRSRRPLRPDNWAGSGAGSCS